MKKFIISSLICFILLSFSQSNAASKNKETYEYLDLFGKIFDRVRAKYVDEVSDEELIEKAIDGMLSGLDPHSGYMDEEIWEEMQMDTRGKFGGLGIEITMEEGFIKVISPIEDTPAYKAGVLAGDFIIQIDDTPVFGLTINEAVELMRGDKGESITITISREGIDPFEINIIRDIIKIQSVKYEVINNVGYLRITSFTEQTESGLLKSIKEIKKETNNKQLGFVLDVRSNPGGLLSQSIKVSDIFLDRGEIVSTRGRNKKDIQRYRAKKGDKINKLPLVVLINGGSASASEIVAGALQDHKRAIIVGTKSFGKGSVQTIIPFSKSNPKKSQIGIRLTTARYYTPSGESIQGKGINPDIIIEQGIFTTNEIKRISEADLKDSLDNENEIKSNLNDEKEVIKNRLENDYQLNRAINLIHGIKAYQDTLSEIND